MNNILIRTCLSLCAAGLLLSASCKKKDDDTTPPATTPTGTVMLHLHEYIDIDEIDAYNIVYTTSAGRKISVSLGQLYITGVQLVKSDNSTVDLPVKLLKVLEAESYTLGTVPTGNYKTIRFKVGLDPATNAENPGTPADSAILNRSEMWLGATAQPDGYTFFNVQGKIDTTTGMTATTAQMQPFVYKIGTNAHYVQVQMPDHPFTVLPDQAEFVHLYADISKLFNGIQVNHAANLSVSSAADNANPIATSIANNIPGIFSYE